MSVSWYPVVVWGRPRWAGTFGQQMIRRLMSTLFSGTVQAACEASAWIHVWRSLQCGDLGVQARLSEHAQSCHVYRHWCRGTGFERVSLEAHLERGEDVFGLEAQFDRWTGSVQVPVNTILIKYEDLPGNIDQVLDFFGVNKPFEVRGRKTSWQDQPEHIQEGLHRVYGRLREKVLAMPGLKILEV